jgi:polar amino acid transport system substrate-binding protein
MLSPRRPWLAPLLMALSLLGLPVASQAGANQPDLLVVTEDWPPYSYAGDNGEIQGLGTEVVKAVLHQAGLSAKIQIYPWARSLLLARNKPGTLIYSLARSKEREAQFIWIGELVPRNDWFFRAAGHRSIAPTSLAEVKHCGSVCLVNKDIVEDDLQRLGFVAQKHYITTARFTDCMKMVQNGSVQLLVSSPVDLAWELKTHPDIHSGFEPVLPLPSSGSEPLYLAASKGTSPEIVLRLRSAFRSLQKSGQIEQIRRQRFDSLRDAPSLPANH